MKKIRRKEDVKIKLGDDFSINENGYILMPNGELAHRFWYFNKIRKDQKHLWYWHVHHINANKLDNTSKNLILLPPDLHYSLHRKFGWNPKYLPKRKSLKKLLKKYLNGASANDLLDPDNIPKKLLKNKNKKKLDYLLSVKNFVNSNNLLDNYPTPKSNLKRKNKPKLPKPLVP